MKLYCITNIIISKFYIKLDLTCEGNIIYSGTIEAVASYCRKRCIEIDLPKYKIDKTGYKLIE